MPRLSRAILAVSALALAGCSTPLVVLKNDKTGQIAQCGGSATGSFIGGVIGYNIQKNNDDKCVRGYMDQGFKVDRVDD